MIDPALVRQLAARLQTLADEAEKAAAELREIVPLLEQLPIEHAGPPAPPDSRQGDR